MKYVAFGIGYQDSKGTIIEESQNHYVVKADGYGIWNIALPKNDKLVKVFETQEERDKWIDDQNYQYDPR